MDLIWTAAIGAVIGWIVKASLDKLLARWRRRRAPLTDAQVKRFHRCRFAGAAVTLTWCVTMLGVIAGEADRINGPVDWAIITGLVTLAIYMARVARRRWRRLRKR
jgi:hypothetical protein